MYYSGIIVVFYQVQIFIINSLPLVTGCVGVQFWGNTAMRVPISTIFAKVEPPGQRYVYLEFWPTYWSLAP